MSALYYLAWRAMGCDVSVQLETDTDGAALLREVPARVETIEARLSRFRPSSELMQFNEQAGSWVVVSDTLYANISAAKHAARLTNGAFNPLVMPALLAQGYDRDFATIDEPIITSAHPAADWHMIELHRASREARIPFGSAVDLGGIAKGWTAALIADELSVFGACLVNFGGDLVARSAPEGLPGWEVAIADPYGESSLATFWLRDSSLMTSGVDFRRWESRDGVSHHHIIDPSTGQSAESDVWTVTVHHPDAVTAEAYTKAVLLAGGQQGLYWIQAQWNAAALLVCRDGAVLATPQFLSHVSERIVL